MQQNTPATGRAGAPRLGKRGAPAVAASIAVVLVVAVALLFTAGPLRASLLPLAYWGVSVNDLIVGRTPGPPQQARAIVGGKIVTCGFFSITDLYAHPFIEKAQH